MKNKGVIEYINRSRFKLSADAQRGKDFQEKHYGEDWQKALDEYRQVS
jgi:hypothetical protein